MKYPCEAIFQHILVLLGNEPVKEFARNLVVYRISIRYHIVGKVVAQFSCVIMCKIYMFPLDILCIFVYDSNQRKDANETKRQGNKST